MDVRYHYVDVLVVVCSTVVVELVFSRGFSIVIVVEFVI